jgi:dethiobiotin synthetase
MEKGIFITGTDTGCGKTAVTLGLMQSLQASGETVLGMKPVASGALQTPAGLRNEDALLIQCQCSGEIPYEWVNPFAYEPPIAPHLAAEEAHRPIGIQAIVEGFTRLSAMADKVVVEGVGGWSVPLNDTDTVADLACQLKLPVILVVGMRLGCINHALLSEASIRQRGAHLVGWVANQVEPEMAAYDGNLSTLRKRLSVPCLGEIPWLAQPLPKQVSGYLDLSRL